MNRQTIEYGFIRPTKIPDEVLDVALKTRRGYFWHPLTYLMDKLETVVAFREPSLAEQTSYRRVAVHTRLSGQDGPIKLRIEDDLLSVELYLDTYSFVQTKPMNTSLGDYPPEDSFDMKWGRFGYWAVSSSVQVYQFEDTPKASKKCWNPKTNVHDHIKGLLDPDEPPTPLTTIALGVTTTEKLPPPRYLEDEHDRLISIFLNTYYTDEKIPPRPGPAYNAQLSEDGFYFIDWVLAPPVPSPSPTP